MTDDIRIIAILTETVEIIVDFAVLALDDEDLLELAV